MHKKPYRKPEIKTDQVKLGVYGDYEIEVVPRPDRTPINTDGRKLDGLN